MISMKDIRKKSDDELQRFVSDQHEMVRSNRFGAAGSKNKNVKERKGLRRSIARALTEVNARKTASAA